MTQLTNILRSEAYKACENGSASATQKAAIHCEITRWRDALTGKINAETPPNREDVISSLRELIALLEGSEVDETQS